MIGAAGFGYYGAAPSRRRILGSSDRAPSTVGTRKGEFDEVYRRHLPAVFRYALRCVGRRDLAEELAADAFVKLFDQFERIDVSQLPAWLFTVVKRAAVDHWRHRVVETRYLSSLEPEPVAVAAPGVRAWLDEAPALTRTHRACLILRYVHGCGRAEIAGRLGLSETQVKGHLQYAHELLRKRLVASE
jgi:RNA polymerase sigma-70 factor (ECF subfamily)